MKRKKKMISTVRVFFTIILFSILSDFGFADELALSDQKLAKIRINYSSEKDLKRLLGEPVDITPDLKYDRILSYNFVQTKKGERFVNNLALLPFTVFVGPIPNSYYEVQQSLSISLDAEGIVKAFQYKSGNEILEAFIDEHNNIRINSNDGKAAIYSQGVIDNPFLRYVNENEERRD